MRKHRALYVGVVEPTLIIFSDEAAKVSVSINFLAFENFSHIAVIDLLQLQFPKHKFLVEIGPLFVVHVVEQGHADLSKLLLIIEIGLFDDQSFVV